MPTLLKRISDALNVPSVPFTSMPMLEPNTTLPALVDNPPIIVVVALSAAMEVSFGRATFPVTSVPTRFPAIALSCAPVTVPST